MTANRPRRVKTDIVDRTRTMGLYHSMTVRKLACGHEQKEPMGGRAHLAETAICKECPPLTTKRSR